jgi:hypothetical protein
LSTFKKYEIDFSILYRMSYGMRDIWQHIFYKQHRKTDATFSNKI